MDTPSKNRLHNIVPYRGVIISSAGTILVTLYPISLALDSLLGWLPLSKLDFAKWVINCLAVALVAAVLNYKSWQDTHQRVRQERGDKRALAGFRDGNNRTLFSGVDEILKRETSTLLARISRISSDVTSENSYFKLFVFVERGDGKFHVVAATAERGSQQLNQVWAKDEGVMPALLSHKCMILVNRNDEGRITAQPFNHLMEVPVAPISPENRAKLSKDATAVLMAPVVVPLRDRDDNGRIEVIGTVVLNTNHPDGMRIFSDDQIGSFVDQIGHDIAPLLMSYRNSRIFGDKVFS